MFSVELCIYQFFIRMVSGIDVLRCVVRTEYAVGPVVASVQEVSVSDTMSFCVGERKII